MSKGVKKEVEQDELPIVESVGWVKQPRGWVVVFTKTQGDKVIEKEVVSEPAPLSAAWEHLRVTVVRKLYDTVRKS